MSTKNQNVMPGNRGRVTHKRFAKQVKTRKALDRIKALRPKISPAS